MASSCSAGNGASGASRVRIGQHHPAGPGTELAREVIRLVEAAACPGAAGEEDDGGRVLGQRGAVQARRKRPVRAVSGRLIELADLDVRRGQADDVGDSLGRFAQVGNVACLGHVDPGGLFGVHRLAFGQELATFRCWACTGVPLRRRHPAASGEQRIAEAARRNGTFGDPGYILGLTCRAGQLRTSVDRPGLDRSVPPRQSGRSQRRSLMLHAAALGRELRQRAAFVLPALFLVLVVPVILFSAVLTPTAEVPDEVAHIVRANSLLHGVVVGRVVATTDALGRPAKDAGVDANPALIAAGFAFAPGVPKQLTKARLARQRDVPWAPATAWDSGAEHGRVHAAVLPPRGIRPGNGAPGRIGTVPRHHRGPALCGSQLCRAGRGGAAAGPPRTRRVVRGACAADDHRAGRVMQPGWADDRDGLSGGGALDASEPRRVVGGCGRASARDRGQAALPAARRACGVRGACKASRYRPASGRAPRHGPPGAALVHALAQRHAIVPFLQPAPYAAGPLWPGPPGELFASWDPAQQLRVVRQHPELLLTLPWQTLRDDGFVLARGVVGILGTLDVMLPDWLYQLWFWALGSVALAAVLSNGQSASRWPAWAGLLGLGCIVGAALRGHRRRLPLVHGDRRGCGRRCAGPLRAAAFAPDRARAAAAGGPVRRPAPPGVAERSRARGRGRAAGHTPATDRSLVPALNRSVTRRG